MDKTYDTGEFTISDKMIHFFGTTLNVSSIDNMTYVDFERHSIFYGLKYWLFGLIFFLVICAIWKKIEFLFTIYLFTLPLLFYFNYKEHKKEFFGLVIQTGAGKRVILKSDSKEFLKKVHNTIIDAINSKKVNYTINFDSHDIVNNGIISKGNNNKLSVKSNDK